MAPESVTSLGSYLRQRRKRLRFTQAEVASAIGLCSAQVSRIESDITNSLVADTAKRLALKLSVRPEYVWSYERGVGIERALVGTVSRRLLELPSDATHAAAADIVFSEARQAYPWIETMSVGIAEADPDLQEGVVRWFHAREITEEATLTGRKNDALAVIRGGVFAADDPTPADCPRSIVQRRRRNSSSISHRGERGRCWPATICGPGGRAMKGPSHASRSRAGRSSSTTRYSATKPLPRHLCRESPGHSHATSL